MYLAILLNLSAAFDKCFPPIWPIQFPQYSPLEVFPNLERVVYATYAEEKEEMIVSFDKYLGLPNFDEFLPTHGTTIMNLSLRGFVQRQEYTWMHANILHSFDADHFMMCDLFYHEFAVVRYWGSKSYKTMDAKALNSKHFYYKDHIVKRRTLIYVGKNQDENVLVKI